MDPVIFHAHHVLRSEDLPFWRKLAIQTGGPVLELGSGTGRVFLRLLKDRFEVTGIDNDPTMVSYLKNSIPRTLGSHARVQLGDMRDLHLPRRFPLILLPCNTLSTFNHEDRQRIFGHVHAHLDPGGTFAFSTPNPLVLQGLPQSGDIELEDEFSHPGTGYPVRVYSSWEKGDGTLTFSWRYDHVFPNGKVVSFDHATTHYLDSPRDYIDELGRNGLKPMAAYGGFFEESFEPDSPYFVVIALQQVLEMA